MLAIPEEVRSCAKLFSPADDPIGTPSSKIWWPDAPSSTPLPPLSSSACRSSFQVVSNCAVVLACPNSYRRANFRRMFRLRTNARAPACASRLIPQSLPVQTVPLSRLFQGGAQSTLVSPCLRHKPHRTPCTHLNNRFCCPFGNISLTRGRSGSSGLFSGRQVAVGSSVSASEHKQKGKAELAFLF